MIELAERTVRDRFKCAMRQLASTVTIVTAEYGGRRHGMVATAVCSLGIDPPSLIASVAHTASLHNPLLTSGRFCVNLLTLSQADLVPVFSNAAAKRASSAGYGTTTSLVLPFFEMLRPAYFATSTQRSATHAIL
jgi:flavin reductase (DIM6/NTAB) family NADH-FMN oxidoreductase RutF